MAIRKYMQVGYRYKIRVVSGGENFRILTIAKESVILSHTGESHEFYMVLCSFIAPDDHLEDKT